MIDEEFPNVKPEKNYKRISNGDVFTGRQILNLLAISNLQMQAIILLDILETSEQAKNPKSKYGTSA